MSSAFLFYIYHIYLKIATVIPFLKRVLHFTKLSYMIGMMIRTKGESGLCINQKGKKERNLWRVS